MSPSVQNPAPGSQQAATIDTPFGKEADLSRFGLRNVKVAVWTADSTTGIHYSVIDYNQHVRKRVYDDYGNAYFKDYPLSDRKTVPYSGQPIPGTAEAGVLVLENGRAKVYVLTGMGIPNNSFRLLIAR